MIIFTDELSNKNHDNLSPDKVVHVVQYTTSIVEHLTVSGKRRYTSIGICCILDVSFIYNFFLPIWSCF